MQVKFSMQKSTCSPSLALLEVAGWGDRLRPATQCAFSEVLFRRLHNELESPFSPYTVCAEESQSGVAVFAAGEM